MLIFTSKTTGLRAGALTISLLIAGAHAGYAQSASTGVSDTDYLSALNSMAADMDLNGLAGQTYAPVTVAAPQLPIMTSDANVVLCDVLQAQAEETKRPFEIIGDDTELTDIELAALSKCLLADSGVLVSYLISDP